MLFLINFFIRWTSSLPAPTVIHPSHTPPHPLLPASSKHKLSCPLLSSLSLLPGFSPRKSILPRLDCSEHKGVMDFRWRLPIKPASLLLCLSARRGVWADPYTDRPSYEVPVKTTVTPLTRLSPPTSTWGSTLWTCQRAEQPTDKKVNTVSVTCRHGCGGKGRSREPFSSSTVEGQADVSGGARAWDAVWCSYILFSIFYFLQKLLCIGINLFIQSFRWASFSENCEHLVIQLILASSKIIIELHCFHGQDHRMPTGHLVIQLVLTSQRKERLSASLSC